MIATRWLCASMVLALVACSDGGEAQDGGSIDLAQDAAVGGGGDLGEDGGGSGGDAFMSLASLKVAIDDPANFSGPSATTINVLQVRDLLMRLFTPTIDQPVTYLTFTLRNPFGTDVQIRRFAFSSDANITSTTDPKDNTVTLPVTQAVMVNGKWQLDFSIPVAGTNLQKRPQPGTWHLIIDVDGHPDYHVDYSIEFTA